MRFLHIADLHLGKMVHGVSMLENGDQPAWADRFLALASELKALGYSLQGLSDYSAESILTVKEE